MVFRTWLAMVMTLLPTVEALRAWAGWECRDIPLDLVLSIIQRESGGHVGIKGGIVKQPVELPTDKGAKQLFALEAGLMQTIPAVVEMYNKTQSPTITIEDLIGHDERAARQQIRVGCWFFALIVAKLHKFDPVRFPGASPGNATEQQLQLALAGYNAGWGALENALSILKQLRQPLTAKAIYKRFATQGIGKGAQYSMRVWRLYKNSNTEIAKTDKGDFWSIGIFAIVAYAISRFFKQSKQAALTA